MRFLVIACALLGVAFGQYVGYTGYPAYAEYPAGYVAGHPGYTGSHAEGYVAGHHGHPVYPVGYVAGHHGYAGYPGYVTGHPGYVAGPPAYRGYLGYPGYATGYTGYPGYTAAYRGHYPQRLAALTAVKPVALKLKELPNTVVSVLPSAVHHIAPIAPLITKTSESHAAIRSQTQESAPDGSYSYSYETENGISAAESGTARIGPAGEDHKLVQGEYAYTSPEGLPVHVRYTADGNGFHPEVNSPVYNGGATHTVSTPVDTVVEFDTYSDASKSGEQEIREERDANVDDIDNEEKKRI